MHWQVTKIKTDNTLGKKLVQARAALGLDLTNISRQHYLPISFLKSIEYGNFEKLPEKLYTRAMLKKYLHILKLPTNECLDLWEEEYVHWKNLTAEKGQKNHSPTLHRSMFNITLTPSFWHKGILIFTGLVFLIYIGMRVEAAIAPTNLEIFSPPDRLTTIEHVIEITGRTEPEVTLTINTQEIPVEQDGFFSKSINLQTGLNVLEIKASKRYRPTHSLIRHILVTE